MITLISINAPVEFGEPFDRKGCRRLVDWIATIDEDTAKVLLAVLAHMGSAEIQIDPHESHRGRLLCTGATDLRKDGDRWVVEGIAVDEEA